MSQLAFRRLAKKLQLTTVFRFDFGLFVAMRAGYNPRSRLSWLRICFARRTVCQVVNVNPTSEHELYLKLFITNGGGW